MNKTLIDNSSEILSMVHAIKECMKTEGINHIRIATGYWDLLGTALVLDELTQFLSVEGNTMELLIGKDPYVYSQQLNKLPENLGKPKYPDDFIRKNIEDLDFTDENKRVVELLEKYCDGDDPRLKIKLYKVSKEQQEPLVLHSKCYIFTESDDEDKPMHAIVGSSNFTRKGIVPLEGNSELNVLETDPYIITAPLKPTKKGHISWFEEKWNLTDELWNKDFLLKVLGGTPIQKQVEKEHQEKEKEENEQTQLTPYELYIKYLYTQFGDIADGSLDTQIKSYIPETYQAYEFQLDAVKQCFHIMKIHGGCFLSDVVGLGKTIVGVLLIRRFIEEAETLGRCQNVLIVTPPAILDGWKQTIKDFDGCDNGVIASHVDYITTGSIGKLTENIEDSEDGDEFDGNFKYSEYGFIVIDESHNFRNKDNDKHKALEALIDSHPDDKHPYIALLSATPQNNSPIDLYNQICFFQSEGANSTLSDIPGKDIETYFKKKDKEFRDLRQLNTPESKEKLEAIAKDIHDKVLQHLVVRRTRADIQNIPEYAKAGLHFPKIKGPQPLKYSMSNALTQLFADTVDKIIAPEDIREQRKKLIKEKKPVPKDYTRIGNFRYSVITYFVDKADAALYEKHNLTVEGITERLAKLMQISLVKRLESSFTAFRQSLKNLRQDTLNMIDMINADTVFVCPDFDVNEQIYKYGSLEKATPIIREKIADNPEKNREFNSDRFKKDELLKDLQNDIKIIDNLIGQWDTNKEDPKFEEFKKGMDYIFFNPSINNPSKKNKQRLVIFTESADTLSFLEDYINNETEHKVLRITSKERNRFKDVIRENFDAMYKGAWKDDYDIILTTEVLAEGVNLHRANVILNYDTPWNATKLMQRIGRVNRIGSQEDCVYVFNFYPSKEGNNYINLYENALNKLQSFHSMFGEDNKVFSDMEELSEADLHNIVEGEVSECAIYISELKTYAKNHAERYEFIKSIELKELGGCIIGRNGDGLLLIGSGGRQPIGFAVNNDGNVRDVSALTFMSELKCSEDTQFGASGKKALPQEMYSKVLEGYSEITNKSLRAKTSSKEQQNAQRCLVEIRKHIKTPEGQETLTAVDGSIRSKNRSVIDKIIKYKDDICLAGKQGLYMDKTSDFALIALFKHLSAQKQITTAKPYLMMFETSLN